MIEQLKLRELIKDRKYFFALMGLAGVTFLVILLGIIYIRPGELLVPIRYSRFDSKVYTLEQWPYLLNFVAFAIVVFLGHLFISAKLYQERGKEFALGFVYLGTSLLAVASVFFFALYKVVAILR